MQRRASTLMVAAKRRSASSCGGPRSGAADTVASMLRRAYAANRCGSPHSIDLHHEDAIRRPRSAATGLRAACPCPRPGVRGGVQSSRHPAARPTPPPPCTAPDDAPLRRSPHRIQPRRRLRLQDRAGVLREIIGERRSRGAAARPARGHRDVRRCRRLQAQRHARRSSPRPTSSCRSSTIRTTSARIAATNAISDVYAMGGTPLFALALVGMPIDKLPVDDDPPHPRRRRGGLRAAPASRSPAATRSTRSSRSTASSRSASSIPPT